MPVRTNRLVTVSLALTIALGACAGGDAKKAASSSGTDPKATATTSVAVKDFVFDAKTITVKKGATVTWTNEDEFDHSVHIDSLDVIGPNFGPMTMPTTYAYQFTEAGTFPYLCGVHNSMTGTVIVTN